MNYVLSFFFTVSFVLLFNIFKNFFEKVICLISPPFYRSIFFKVIFNLIFSCFLVGCLRFLFSPFALYIQVILVVLLSLWCCVYLCYSACNKVKNVDVHCSQNNFSRDVAENIRTNHMREAALALLYIVFIPLIYFVLPIQNIFGLSHLIALGTLIATFVFSVTWLYYIIAIIGFVLFFLFVLHFVIFFYILKQRKEV